MWNRLWSINVPMELMRRLSEIKWEAKVGDPYLLAWLVVAAYLFAAFGCIACAIRAEQIFGRHKLNFHRTVWGGLGAVMLFLAINKQLDLQTLFTQIMKVLAKNWDIYELGRRSRKYFVFGLGLFSAGVMAWIMWNVRRQWRRYVILLLGVIFIVRFIIVRAGTFYGVRLPELSRFTGGIRVNGMLELTGALVVAASAYLNLWTAQKARRK
ncbi:MAG: hypothetical protein JXR76_29355 [Deltaproteobacteria bacterium]|nr:hypothetical protein [Deltaproteobacteria bacterium]